MGFELRAGLRHRQGQIDDLGKVGSQAMAECRMIERRRFEPDSEDLGSQPVQPMGVAILPIKNNCPVSPAAPQEARAISVLNHDSSDDAVALQIVLDLCIGPVHTCGHGVVTHGRPLGPDRLHN